MRIISLNAWGGRLCDPLLDWIAAAAPDVLCLQEVVHSPLARQDWLTYRDGDHVLPQRANLFREVEATLPGHRAQFCPAAQGELWDGNCPVPSHWGIATFVRRELPIIAQAQGFVHKSYSAHGFGDHPRSRCAHAVTLHDPARDQPITVAHMHGLRDPRGKHDTPDRTAQAHRLLDLVQGVASPDAPLVVCGDFNVEPDSRTFAILARAGLRDLVLAGGFPGTRTAHYTKPGRFADYLLVNRHVAIAGFAVIYQPEVSDHCPLVLDI